MMILMDNQTAGRGIHHEPEGGNLVTRRSDPNPILDTPALWLQLLVTPDPRDLTQCQHCQSTGY